MSGFSINISSAISILDKIVVKNPIMKVLRPCVDRSYESFVVNLSLYLAVVVNTSF